MIENAENKDETSEESTDNIHCENSDVDNPMSTREGEFQNRVEPIRGQTVPMSDAGFTKASSSSTQIAGEESDNEMDFLPEKIDFTGNNGVHFIVDFSRELGRGGEAVVVAAYDESGQEFAAKVYNQPQTRREQRNHNAVLEFLSSRSNESIESYRASHLMPLLEYGTISATIIGEERPGEYNISIMPKCDCLGDRAISREDVKKRIIPSLAEALNTLHSQNIVHRDVKPSNIYEYNGIVVLGDYGISTVLDKDANLKDTHANRGTAGYWLPVGYVEPRGDWYSLGYTIWTMYNNNVHPHQDLIDAGNLLGNVYAGKRVVPFEPVRDEDASLKDLVYGLTTVYADKRLGYADIQQWISNPIEFEFDDPGNEESDGWRHKYEFDSIKAVNGTQLAQALSSNWDFAIQHLFDGNDLVEHFSRNGENDISTKLRVIVREFAGEKQDLGMAEAIFLISGSDERMTWKGKDVSFPVLVSDFASKPIEELASYDELFQSGFLSWALREGGLDAAGIDANIVELIEDVSEKDPQYARSLFQHLFAGGGVSEYSGFKSSDDLVWHYVDDPQQLYSIMGQREKLKPCLASMAPFYADKNKLEKLVTSIDSFDNNSVSNMNSFLLLLEAIDERNIVVEFAATYGPSAPWLWFGRNVSLYEIRDRESADSAKTAIETFADFKNLKLSTVQEIAERGEEAKYQAEIVRQAMDSSPVFSYLGAKTDKSVIAKCDDAYFCADFYGEAVPRGFVRELALAPKVKLSSWPEVNLLSSDAMNEKGHLESVISQCNTDLEECENAKSASGSKAIAIFRLALDVAMALIMLLVAPSISEILAPMAACFLGIFNGTIDAGNIFTQFTIATLCFAFTYDGVISFWLVKGSSTIASAIKEIEGLKNSLEQEFVDFQLGSSEFARELKDYSKNEQHMTLQMTERLEEATKNALSVASQGNSPLYIIIWHIAAVVSVTYCTAVALVPSVPIVGIPPWITVFIVFIAVGVVYELACRKYGKVGSQLYTSYGLLGMILAGLCAIALAIILVFLVHALIAVVVAIVGLIVAVAILFGLLSS